MQTNHFLCVLFYSKFSKIFFCLKNLSKLNMRQVWMLFLMKARVKFYEFSLLLIALSLLQNITFYDSNSNYRIRFMFNILTEHNPKAYEVLSQHWVSIVWYQALPVQTPAVEYWCSLIMLLALSPASEQDFSHFCLFFLQCLALLVFLKSSTPRLL